MDILAIIDDKTALKAKERSVLKPAFHPCDSFKRNYLSKEESYTHEVIATKLNISAKDLAQFLNSKINIDADFAARLQNLTGFSDKTWLELQNRFNLFIASIAQNKQ